MLPQYPTDRGNPFVSTGLTHAQKQDATMGASGIIDQCAKVMVLGNEDALVSYSPCEDVRVDHMGVHVANKDDFVAIQGQGLSNAASYIVIDKKFHAGSGRRNTRSEATRSAA